MEGKNILITGASSGIGEACVKQLDRKDNTLVLVARSKEKLEKLKEEAAGTVHVIPFDLNELERMDEIFAYLRQHEIVLDGMIHSAGVNMDCPIKVNNVKKMEEVMRVNCFSFLELGKYFYKKRHSCENASVVAISSMAAESCDMGMAAYSASKAALNAAVKTMSKEFLRRRIRVNAILPGGVETPMAREKEHKMAFISGEEGRDRQPLGTIKPERIAQLAKYLLSEQAEYITGALMPVSGGRDS